MINPVKIIAFDADDTLWVNEPYFQETEQQFCQLLADYLPPQAVSRELLQVEIQNLPLYGYGIKGFMLSMIQTALQVSGHTLPAFKVDEILQLGKALLARPIELLDGIEEVLSELKEHYRLVVATKGDLLDQERKLRQSGIAHHFHHIEIMSDKGEKDYQKLIRHLDIAPEAFLMVGNSVKSDVLPVLQAGGHAFHIPYHTTWAHEATEQAIHHFRFRQLTHIRELPQILLPCNVY